LGVREICAKPPEGSCCVRLMCRDGLAPSRFIWAFLRRPEKNLFETLD
jgi:hypothetical protein